MNLGPLSIVVLIKDETPHLTKCLDALVPQLEPYDEVLLVDATGKQVASDVVEEASSRWNVPLRLHACAQPTRAGAALSLAIGMTRQDAIVFLGAHAIPARGWLDAMRRALVNADIVYGSRRHEPTLQNLATVVRGLRDHDAHGTLPEERANDSNAAYRRLVFDTIPLDADAEGDPSPLLARAARFEGLRLRHASDALVHLNDVSSFGAEWRRHLLDGASHARHRGILEPPTIRILWVAAVSLLGILGTLLMSAPLIAWMVLTFLAPAIRHLSRPLRRSYRAAPLFGATMASPLFDLAFVFAYLRRRLAS